MEKKEKAWQRRGLFALVSNRRQEHAVPGDDPFLPAEEDEGPLPDQPDPP